MADDDEILDEISEALDLAEHARREAETILLDLILAERRNR